MVKKRKAKRKQKLEKEDKIILSHSRIQMWKNCHYDHYQKYVNKLVPKGKSNALVRGNMIHDLLETYYNYESWTKKWEELSSQFYESNIREEIDFYGDIPKMSRDLLESYINFWESDDREQETLSNEARFEIHLFDNVYLEGYIDRILFDSQGNIFVKDYKTFSRMPDLSSLRYNYQSAIYIYALQQYGYPVDGMVWDIIKAKQPTYPKLTAGGVISKAKIETTPEVMYRELIKLGMDEEEAQEMADEVDASAFFRRFVIKIQQETIDFLMKDIIETAHQIIDFQHTLKDMNLKTTFKSHYYELWEAEAAGIDADYVRRTRYDVREGGGRDLDGVKELEVFNKKKFDKLVKETF